MAVRFEKNAYFKAIKEQDDLNSEEKIVDYAKNHQQFNYGNVTFRKFKDRHTTTEGWLGRKVIALPAVLWSGVVKTIYHLAKAILVGVIARSGENKYLKAQFFYIARGLQESFGWLATLFNDKFGQYHIQESEFHKSCYDCFLEDNMQPEDPQPRYTNYSYQPRNNSSRAPTSRPVNLSTNLPSNSFYSYSHDRQNQFHASPDASYFPESDFEKKLREINKLSDSLHHTNFTNRRSQPSDKQSVINMVMSDPNSFSNLSYDLKNDEDVVAAALSGCRTPEQAKKVISSANYDAKNSKKVALALVKIDPTQFGQLNYDAKNDEDVVAAALSGCRTPEQAKKVISSANYDAKNSKKVALALVKIDPTLLGQLNYDAKNDVDVVLLAIHLSTEHTINKIWRSVGVDAAFNKEVRAKVKKMYPSFFQDQTFEGAFPNFFQDGTHQGSQSSNPQYTPNQTSYGTPQTKWNEPDDLKSDTSDGANIARKILKQNYLLDIDLTKVDVSKEKAKGVLCQLLELDRNTLDKELKKAYKKAVLKIHPDKLKLKSGEEAFKVLTAAYQQADL